MPAGSVVVVRLFWKLRPVGDVYSADGRLFLVGFFVVCVLCNRIDDDHQTKYNDVGND